MGVDVNKAGSKIAALGVQKSLERKLFLGDCQDFAVFQVKIAIPDDFVHDKSRAGDFRNHTFPFFQASMATAIMAALRRSRQSSEAS